MAGSCVAGSVVQLHGLIGWTVATGCVGEAEAIYCRHKNLHSDAKRSGRKNGSRDTKPTTR